jgi:hypothetical protein
MHKLVRAISKDKLSKALRLSSLAGNGLPERMRTTAFAFLGLTAAAGLALVAIFAQLGFNVLSPAPLPSASPDAGDVAAAVPLRQQRRVTVAEARHAAVVAPASGPRAQGGFDSRGSRGRGSVDGSAVPLPAGSAGPAPVGPDPSVTEPAPGPAPAPGPVEGPGEPPPAAAPVSTPLPEPASKPGKSTAAVPKADEDKGDSKDSGGGHGWERPPKPAKPKPVKSAKPPKQEAPKPEAAPAPEPTSEPAPPPVPEGKGKGKKDK